MRGGQGGNHRFAKVVNNMAYFTTNIFDATYDGRQAFNRSNQSLSLLLMNAQMSAIAILDSLSIDPNTG